MKKLYNISFIIFALLLLVGCGNQAKELEPKQAINDDTSKYTVDLSKYGEKARKKEMKDVVNYSGKELGLGSLINHTRGFLIKYWYFIPNKDGKKYLLDMDEDCLLDSIGLIDVSCEKYFELNENKKIYDGVHGPSVRIFGVLEGDIIKVSNMTIVQ